MPFAKEKRVKELGLRRLFWAIRYSLIGVFITGIIGVIQGCSVEREGVLAAVLLVLLQFCSAPMGIAEKETPAPCTGGSFSSGNLSVRIPTIGGIGFMETQTLNVACDVTITDINVAIRFDHTDTEDLIIFVRHPDGTSVELSNDDDTTGEDFGTGADDCTSTFTVFDDEAATAISTGSPPYAGSFRPRGSLSDFDGKSATGDWKLEIEDVEGPLDIGELFCWQVVIN